MKAILIVDHGSRMREANDMLRCMANLIQTMAGSGVVVRYAHMELADPDIASGFEDCVQGGASEVIVFPYMLSPGRHSTSDIPRMVADAAKNFPNVSFAVTPAFGVHEKLAEIVLARAGLERVFRPIGAEADRCWDPECSESLCGHACRAKTSNVAASVDMGAKLRA